MIHVTSGFVAPGADARQVLEMSNVAGRPLAINPACASVRWCCSAATAARSTRAVSRGKTRCDGHFSRLKEGAPRADTDRVPMHTLRHVVRRLLLAACLAAVLTPAPAAASLDGFNETMLSFNQWFLRHVMEPVGRGWNFVVPKFFQRRVVDFMSNTEEPRDVINSMLQWKPRRAGIHAGRFLLNTTFGIAGFYDVSTRNLDFIAPPETTDETFGVWRIRRARTSSCRSWESSRPGASSAGWGTGS
jgi:hypothetical protein